MNRVVPFLAWANASWAVISALLGAAPFTPAAFLFVIHAPLAALFGRLGHARAALLTVGAGVLAVLLTPFRHEASLPLVLIGLFLWVVAWLVVAAVFSLKRTAQPAAHR